MDDGYTQVGTLDYMAPEILDQHKSAYTEAVDVWAVGIIVYELLYGKAPFSDPDFERSCTNITSCKLPLSNDVSEHVQDFLRRVLRKVRGHSACVHYTHKPKHTPLPLRLARTGDAHSAVVQVKCEVLLSRPTA